MFFSKSYSDNAVQKSAKWIRFFNDNLNSLLSMHEAKYHSKITKFFSVQHLGVFDRQKKEAAIIMKTFVNGAMMSILNHFFDGKNKDFDKFAKEAIILAFDLGFGMNDGKSKFKSFMKDKMQLSDFKSSGENWVDKFFIPEVIKENLSMEEVEDKFTDHEYEKEEGNDSEDDYDRTYKKTKVKISKVQLKKDFQILKKFIENYQIPIKEDEDYYEHDISFDEKNKQFKCKLDVFLENEPDTSYPFIEFVVDFSDKEVTFDPRSINSNIYSYQDIDDLKEIIEEEIDKS